MLVGAVPTSTKMVSKSRTGAFIDLYPFHGLVFLVLVLIKIEVILFKATMKSLRL